MRSFALSRRLAVPLLALCCTSCAATVGRDLSDTADELVDAGDREASADAPPEDVAPNPDVTPPDVDVPDVSPLDVVANDVVDDDAALADTGPDVDATPWQDAGLCDESPARPTPASDAGADLLRANMVGTWTGVATSPWVPPYDVVIRFGADGHYSAHAVGASVPAFYYGTDADDPRKTYELQYYLDPAGGHARIDILYDVGTLRACTLEDLRTSADGDQLTFDFFNDSHGPVHYALTRACP